MDRPANDTTTEARVVSEVYLIDPATKKPYAAGGGGGGSISAVATADAPTYAEGESEPLSMDLGGGLRVVGTFEAPVGGATEAKQVDGNASLASIDGKLTTLDGRVDQLEGLLTSTNEKLDTLNGYASDTGTLNVAQDTDAIKSGSTSLTPKFAKISLSASGDLVAAVTGKKIRVLAYNLMAAADVTVKFQSGGTTDVTGAKPCGAKGGLAPSFNPVGWFETAVGEKLNMVLGGSVAVGGELVYIEVE